MVVIETLAARPLSHRMLDAFFDYLLSVHSEKEISDSSQNRETNKLNRAKGRNDLSSCHIHNKFVVMFCDNSQYCDVYRRLTMFVKRETGSPQGR